jgi:hypothetical protein
MVLELISLPVRSCRPRNSGSIVWTRGYRPGSTRGVDAALAHVFEGAALVERAKRPAMTVGAEGERILIAEQ